MLFPLFNLEFLKLNNCSIQITSNNFIVLRNSSSHNLRIKYSFCSKSVHAKKLKILKVGGGFIPFIIGGNFEQLKLPSGLPLNVGSATVCNLC